MGWKNYPIWLRGGIIAVLVSLIAFILNLDFINDLLFTSAVTPDGYDKYPILAMIQGMIHTILAIIASPIEILGWLFIWGDNFKGGSNTLVMIYILGLILSFIVGAIIGLIIGKIKSRK